MKVRQNRGDSLLRTSKYAVAEIVLSEIFGKYLTQWRLVPDVTRSVPLVQ